MTKGMKKKQDERINRLTQLCTWDNSWWQYTDKQQAEHCELVFGFLLDKWEGDLQDTEDAMLTGMIRFEQNEMFVDADVFKKTLEIYFGY